MRDFRDAKVMARTLRSALAAKGLKITVGQSLELIAELFGVDGWNTLAAAIHREGPTPRKDASPDRFQAPMTRRYSRELELTLHRTLGHADQRNHEYATLEHLLFALIDDVDASAVMKACKADLGLLKKSVANYIDIELETLVTEDDREPTPTAGFQRVVQRAVRSAEALDREATGADLLVAMFNERESPAVWLLGERDITHYDAVSFINRQVL
jgi:Glyoxalase superfamily protein/Clp amino terminal domain, pathogenicity island component